MILYPIFAEKMAPPTTKSPSGVILISFGVAGAIAIGVATWARLSRIRPALETLRLKSDDPPSLQSWRFGSLLSYVMLESVVLYGLAFRFLGGSRLESLPFYCAGIALMLVYWPQQP